MNSLYPSLANDLSKQWDALTSNYAKNVEKALTHAKRNTILGHTTSSGIKVPKMVFGNIGINISRIFDVMFDFIYNVLFGKIDDQLAGDPRVLANLIFSKLDEYRNIK